MSFIWNIVAALVPMVIGFLWYHPKTFEKPWRESVGLSEEQVNSGNMALIFGLSFIGALIMTIPLGYWANHADDGGGFNTFGHGAFHGLFPGLGVAGMVLLSNGLFSRRSLKGIFIDIAYWTLTIMVMSGILDAMQ